MENIIDNKYARNVIVHLYRTGAQTRGEIMKALKMRQNALVETCDALEEAGWLLKSDPERRRNVDLHLNPKRFGIIGLDHQIKEARLVMLDGHGRKIHSAHMALPDEGNGERLERLIGLTTEFLNKYRTMEIVGIGMADVGVIDAKHGVGLFSAHVPNWRNLPLQERFFNEFKLHFSLIDRVDAGCLASLKGKTHENSLRVWCGDGIGMSILRKGEFIGRGTPFSGQLGHTIAERGGKLCHCGNRGCLETIAGAGAICQKVRELTGSNAELPEIIQNARDGNRICETVLREAGEAVGVALANAVVLIGINRILIQGTLCNNNPFFCSGLEQELRKNVMYPLNRDLNLEISVQGDDDTAEGAALFERRTYFENLKTATT